MKTLICSGKRKYHGMDCHAVAVWAIKRVDGTHWYGACHLHPHQVLKRLGGDGAELQVWTAEAAAEEVNRRVRDSHAVTRARDMIGPFRSLVQGTRHIWTVQRSVDALVQHGHLPLPADAEQLQNDCLMAGALLEMLHDEGVVEPRGQGRYEPVGVPSRPEPSL